MQRPSRTVAVLSLWILLAASAGHTQTPGADPVVEWLRAQSHHLLSVNPSADDSDLQFLKAALAGVRVVGLGEAAHGTREFVLLKHRLVRFLITQMGFMAVAIEAPSADTEPINDYVVSGKGDLATVVTGQGYTAWDTEEMTNMIAWIRGYNSGVPDARKVRFIGLDIIFNTRGRARVLEYLSQHAPQRVPETEAVFRVLEDEEKAVPFRTNRDRLAGALGQFEALRQFLIEEQARLEPGPARELDPLVRDVQRMVQRSLSALPASDPRRVNRSQSMGRNVLELLKGAPDAKIIVWAHDSHVAVRAPNNDANLGSEVRAVLGPSYYCIALEFGSGSSQMRRADPQGIMGDLEEVAMPAAPSGSLPWYLSQVGAGNLVVNLHAPRTPSIEQWLERPLSHHFLSWANQPGTLQTMVDGTAGRYDGLLLVEKVSMSHPTKNARERVAKREGF
jgi:erythromycin esterase